jgi:hypothetical protein
LGLRNRLAYGSGDQHKVGETAEVLLVERGQHRGFGFLGQSDKIGVHDFDVVGAVNLETPRNHPRLKRRHARSIVASRQTLPYTRLMPIMKAVELQGEIDDQHRLHADVPQSLPAGSVRVIVFIPEEDEGGLAWAAGLRSEWSEELNDPAQDIYTLNDGQPIDAPR